MGTGVIFAAVVIAWAVFLVPWALRRYDEATRTRSVDKFSKAMRLFGRAERFSAAEARAGTGASGRADGGTGAAGTAVVGTAAAGTAVAIDSRGADRVDSDRPAEDGADVNRADLDAEESDDDIDAEAAMYPDSVAPEAVAARRNLRANHVSAPVEETHRPSRAAARIAARRRRRVLLMLLGATTFVGALAALAVVPLWSLLIPAALVVTFLALCRWQVRQEDDATWDRRRAKESAHDSEDGSGARSAAAEDSEGAEGRQTAEADAEPVGDADLVESTAVAVTVSTDDGHPLWDPLPVTLPTYVSKAKATRTVRTIDLGEPDTWTSGHVEGEQTDMPSDATASGADAKGGSGSDSDDAHRRAVGD